MIVRGIELFVRASMIALLASAGCGRLLPIGEDDPLATPAAAVPSDGAAPDGVAAPADDLILHLPFDEGSGDRALDRSVNHNDALLVDGAAWTAGRAGGALGLDGIGAHASVPSHGSLEAVDRLTVALWVRPTAEDVVLISLKDSWFVRLNGGQPELDSRGKDQRAKIGITLPTDAWTHLAFVFDGGNVKGYVNGAPNDPQDFITPTFAPGDLLPRSSGPLVVGASNDGSSPSDFTEGAIDDVRLYRRALTAPEIAALAQ